jgi:hypothetical protein
MMMRSQINTTKLQLDAIDPKDVHYYWAEGGSLNEVKKDMFGFIKTPFDKTIDEANLIQDQLTSRIEGLHDK